MQFLEAAASDEDVENRPTNETVGRQYQRLCNASQLRETAGDYRQVGDRATRFVQLANTRVAAINPMHAAGGFSQLQLEQLAQVVNSAFGIAESRANARRSNSFVNDGAGDISALPFLDPPPNPAFPNTSNALFSLTINQVFDV